MSSKPTDEIFEHAFDGIQEYDNPIPSYVNWILFGTFLYSIFHVIYVEFGPGQTVAEEYASAVQAVQDAKPEVPKEALALNEKSLSVMMSDAEYVASGRQSFETYCVACHAENGEGQIGPNLTDAHWIHGDGSLMAIRGIIKDGVLEKGMPSWEMQLSPDQLNQVSAYVGTLRFTNVPGKEPEGSPVEPQAPTKPTSVEDGETASL